MSKCYRRVGQGHAVDCIEEECALWIRDEEHPSYSYNEKDELNGIWYPGMCAKKKQVYILEQILEKLSEGVNVHAKVE